MLTSSSVWHNRCADDAAMGQCAFESIRFPGSPAAAWRQPARLAHRGTRPPQSKPAGSPVWKRRSFCAVSERLQSVAQRGAFCSAAFSPTFSCVDPGTVRQLAAVSSTGLYGQLTADPLTKRSERRKHRPSTNSLILRKWPRTMRRISAGLLPEEVAPRTGLKGRGTCNRRLSRSSCRARLPASAAGDRREPALRPLRPLLRRQFVGDPSQYRPAVGAEFRMRFTISAGPGPPARSTRRTASSSSRRVRGPCPA
jgi:hypothetical protein